MNKLEEKYLEVISKSEARKYINLNDWGFSQIERDISQSCTNITIEFAKGFIEFVEKGSYWYSKEDNVWRFAGSLFMEEFTLDQLIETYIKTL